MGRKKEKPEQAEKPDRQEGEKPKRKRGAADVKFYRRWCKECGICAEFCPTGALKMGPEGPEWKHPEKCVACRMCELRCPDFAVEVVEDE